MAGDNFEETVSSFQATEDVSKLLKYLIDIRKEVDWPKNKDNINKLCKRGALKQIVLALHTGKKAIIDVSLSILGNCCLDARCSQDLVSQFNILPGLNQVLKKYSKEDSINGRVFRIVGNLCQHKDQWGNVIIEKKPQLVIHTVNFLKDVANTEDDSKISEASVIMAIRSLREFLNPTTLEDLVKTYGVLKVIGLLLIKYGAIWEKTKKSEKVITNIIKLLQEYSRHKNYSSILELRNTDKGDSIVFLSKVLMVAPRQVIKIIMNFLKISHLNSDLPIPEIFDSFIETLKNNSLIKEFDGTCEECVRCICLLLDHPGNRKNEHCGESIPILVNVLKDLTLDSSNKIECCILLVSTLNKCKYNESLIWDQIKNNIIEVLTGKLQMIVGSSIEPLALVHKSDKKRRSSILTKKVSKKNRKTDYPARFESPSSGSDTDIFYFATNQYDLSPGSSCESDLAMSWTSGLSPRSSPRFNPLCFSESDSDDYSPICSEADPSEMHSMDHEHSPINQCSSEVNFEDDEHISHNYDFDTNWKMCAKKRLLLKIVDLLKTYVVKLRPPLSQLGTSELLLTLIKNCVYIELTESATIHDVLELISRILESHEYLLPLMQTNFIPAVFNLSELQHGVSCYKCRQFQWISSSVLRRMSKLAESGAGKGDIAHKLLRGDSEIKQQLVLVIPYIVRNKSILVKLMLNCGGLEILMKLLQEEASDLQEKSIKVVCMLAAKKLCILNPKDVKSSYKITINDIDNSQSAHVVAFKLDDGSVVRADRSLLSQNSDFFSRLLNGDFKKSSHKITINDIDNSQSAHVVAFKLDDGSVVRADRSLLSQNSDFFSRLLNGDFKESNQDEIVLHNVINKSFQCLLHLIKCDIDRTAPVDFDLDLTTHLDVIALCDRFLMPEFCVYLTDCVEKYRLSFETIPVIYQWSVESRTNLLRVECIAFALVTDINDSERYEMFKNLFELGCTEELAEDIRKLLVRYLTLNQFQEGIRNKRKKKTIYCGRF